MAPGRGAGALCESGGRHSTPERGGNLGIEKGDVVLVDAPEGTPLEGQPALLHPEDESPYLLPINDEHTVHIQVHEEILLDDSKPWPTRQLMAMHIAEHQSMLQLLEAAAVQAEAGAAGEMSAATNTAA